MRTIHSSRSRVLKAFTLIELLVVISIIALLISILLPALGKARTVANTARDAANMQQIGRAIAIYASDNNNYAPLFGGLSGTDDAPNGDCAGASIWARNPGGVSAAQNAPVGLGVLLPAGPKATPPSYAKFGDYLATIDVLFSPSDRLPTRDADGSYPNPGPYASFWALRDWYGDARVNGWNQQGPWGLYVSGANFNLDVSYIYRGDDYSWYDPAISTARVLSNQTQSHVSPGNNQVLGGARRTAGQVNARLDSTGWGGKSIMMTRSFNLLDSSRLQANVMRGDFSVNLEANTAWLNHLANTSVAQNWYLGQPGYFESRKFALLDYYKGY